MTSDYAAYIASLPKVLAAAMTVLRDDRGSVLLVKPDYGDDDCWLLPGGTVESDQEETPRQAARRETAEEIGLTVDIGALLAVDWVTGRQRPPMISFVYDGGVLTAPRLSGIRLQPDELTDWRLVPPEELDDYLPPHMARSVRAALAVQRSAAGPAELEDGFAAAKGEPPRPPNGGLVGPRSEAGVATAHGTGPVSPG
nr:NUDIX hydrolase [Streptomyces sp. TP-A0874]